MGSSPGPWGWGYYDDQDLIEADSLCQHNGSRIGVYSDPAALDEADAKLIAAAPEMAAMLKSLEWVPIEKPPGWTAGDWLTTSQKACPVCRVIHVPDGSSFAEPGLENGHTADCRLAALLKELP